MAGSIVGSIVQHRSRGLVRLKALITCDASGDASVTVVGSLFGKVVGVIYDAGTLATGVDITVTDSESGATIFSLTNAGTADRFIRPTQVVTDNTGTAVTAAATAVDVNRDIFLAGRVSVVAAQGGNLGAGALTFLVDEGVAA
jgi:uncharacterized membrane protein